MARGVALEPLERNIATLRRQGMSSAQIAAEIKDGLTADRVDEILLDLVFKLQGRTPTPEQLRDLATREHVATVWASQSVIEHAIAAGLALQRAKDLIPTGEWDEWCRDNLAMPRHTARTYMRIARHRTAVRAAAITGVGEALNMIATGLPRDADLRIRAIAEADPAKAPAEIADAVGVTEGQVTRVLDPAKHEDGNRRARERDTERARSIAAAREAKVRELGGPVALAYARLTAALSDLRAALELSDVTRRRHLTGVMRSVELALDQIVATADLRGRGA